MRIAIPQLFYTAGALRSESDAYDVFAVGDVTVYSGSKIGGFTELQIADAVVHAANAYPKVVAALRAILASENIVGCPGGLWSTADDSNYRKAEAARQLLKELGEDFS